LIALAGCGGDTRATSTPTQTTVSTDTKIIITSVVISSTAVALPTSTAVPTIQSADTKGWDVYRDTRYPFRMPIPPGWQIFALSDSTPATTCSWYDVALFPPGSHPVKLEPLPETNPSAEYMTLSVPVGCNANNYGLPPGATPESQQVSIGGQLVTIYDDTWHDDVSIRRATAKFGGLAYWFGLQTGPTDQPEAIALFLGMLKGFTFTAS
jgi:hypothetical protein